MVSVVANAVKSKKKNQDLLDLYEKASKGGKVSLESFFELAENHSIQLGEAELEAFDSLADSKGVVSKEHFCQFAKDFDLVSRFESSEPDTLQHADEKIWTAFRVFDKNGDGMVTKAEFRSVS